MQQRLYQYQRQQQEEKMKQDDRQRSIGQAPPPALHQQQQHQQQAMHQQHHPDVGQGSEKIPTFRCPPDLWRQAAAGNFSDASAHSKQLPPVSSVPFPGHGMNVATLTHSGYARNAPTQLSPQSLLPQMSPYERMAIEGMLSNQQRTLLEQRMLATSSPTTQNSSLERQDQSHLQRSSQMSSHREQSSYDQYQLQQKEKLSSGSSQQSAKPAHEQHVSSRQAGNNELAQQRESDSEAAQKLGGPDSRDHHMFPSTRADSGPHHSNAAPECSYTKLKNPSDSVSNADISLERGPPIARVSPQSKDEISQMKSGALLLPKTEPDATANESTRTPVFPGNDEYLSGRLEKPKPYAMAAAEHGKESIGKGTKRSAPSASATVHHPTTSSPQTSMVEGLDGAKHSCAKCNRVFKDAFHLRRHNKTHTGERQHKCENCGKAFFDTYHLNRHIRTHTGERPYKCDVCEKGFNSAWHLNRHINTHTGDKPYQCSVCDKGFTTSSHLHRHEFRAHNITSEKFPAGFISKPKSHKKKKPPLMTPEEERPNTSIVGEMEMTKFSALS